MRRLSLRKAWLILAVVVPTAGWVLVEAQRTFRAEWATLHARQTVNRWSASEPVPDNQNEWNSVLASLQKGLDLTPDDPALYEQIGDLYCAAGRRDWENTELRRDHHKRAAAHYEKALALRPGSAAVWAALASARQAADEEPLRVQAAWSQALRLGPFEGHVQPLLLQVVLAQWQTASPVMQDWAKALFDSSDVTTQAQINVTAKHYGLVFTTDAPSKTP